MKATTPHARSTPIPASHLTRTTLASILAVAALWTSGCGTTTSTAPAPAGTAPTVTVEASPTVTAEASPTGEIPTPTGDSEALALLSTLSVKGRAPKTGYERSMFGQSWTDDVDVDGGHNGCDTRNDILGRDLTAVATREGTRGCKVLSGVLFDEYSGETIEFVSGQDTSQLVQIDHVVALSNAWQTGAQQLDEATRTEFANDPLNLQAVGGAVNQQKSDGDAATWLPPRKAFRCTYVERQIRVKARYGLWVTQAEHDAMVRVLGNCVTDDAPPAATPSPTSTTAATPVDGVRYANCAEVRAAGAAPLHAGSPGYRTGLDGDGDGVACE